MDKGLDFHKIGKYHKYPAVVKLFAREFIEGASYFTPGRWFQELSTPDLDMLSEMGENMEGMGIEGETIVLLTEMLTAAEGVNVLNAEGAQKRVAYLRTLLIIEKLYRTGQVEMDHAAISFGDDELSNDVAWPKGEPKPTKKPKR